MFTANRSSDTIDEGTWTTSFDEPGIYSYQCTVHSGMTGQIIVVST